MNLLVRLSLAVLATYRLAGLVSAEEGPFSIFDRIRAELGAYDYAENGQAETALGRGISCVLCTGIYLAGALLFLVYLPSTVGDIFLAWMGVSGAQAFLVHLAGSRATYMVAESTEEEND